MPSSEPAALRRHDAPTRRRWLGDVVGVTVVVVAVLAVLAPALRPGVTLGPYDLLSRVGLTARPGVRVHSTFPSDQVLYFLPMLNLAWHQVHSGHLPLWNPYNVLGMPIAFSWQSGVFSLPVLVGYLFPLAYAYAAIIAVKLVVAGTGAYVLCRVLRLSPLSSAFGGIAFELSGPMVHYSGWAMTGVTAWGGWILAFAVLVVRGRHRVRDGILLALAVALAVYGGHPESVLVLALSAAVFLAVYLWRRRPTGAPVLRPVVDLGMAALGGIALAAPLILPGAQVAGLSSRASASGAPPFGLGHLPDLAVALQGTDPRVPSPYLGVITLLLAALALRMAWRRPAVLALGVTAVVALLLCFKNPLYSIVDALPKIHSVTWNREAMLLALSVAVLGAVGLEQLVHGEERWRALRFSAFALGAVGLVVVVTGLAVAAGALHAGGARGAAFAWPAAELAGAALVLGLLAVNSRARSSGQAESRRRYGAGALLVLQGAALVGSGVSFWSLSSSSFAPTAAVTRLQQVVGTSIVARSECLPLPFTHPDNGETGLRPNTNVAYSVHELAAYEPVLPRAYYRSWLAVSGVQEPRTLVRVGVFCPVMSTVAEARIYGASYVLVAAGRPGPPGASRVAVIQGEQVFHVPGAAEATLVTPSMPGPTPVDAPGTPLSVRHPDDASWRVVTDSTAPQLLRLRLTNVPGWRATIDGRPLRLRGWAEGAMLEAKVPAGHDVVVLRYWPPLFSGGLVLALLAVLAGVVLVVGALRRSARSRRSGSP